MLCEWYPGEKKPAFFQRLKNETIRIGCHNTARMIINERLKVCFACSKLQEFDDADKRVIPHKDQCFD